MPHTAGSTFGALPHRTRSWLHPTTQRNLWRVVLTVAVQIRVEEIHKYTLDEWRAKAKAIVPVITIPPPVEGELPPAKPTKVVYRTPQA